MLRDRIGEEKIRGAERLGDLPEAFCEVRFGFVQIAPALETHQVRIKALSSQLLDMVFAGPGCEQSRVCEQHEGCEVSPERLRLPSLAPKDPVGGLPLTFEGEET